ncbi:hypothetical protein ACTFBT_38550 [Streptomyces microflavus]|uniref:Uncharacterized protein n=1 Tax=Streptomyces microflavus TaxID=1919 RepID=A0A7J0D805_STRMI|nr:MULTISPECIES: hypothetical protein [Streptomyces]MDX2982182.1 hypothetical protein [Streptomyces sp. NRRL_B-2249]GFN09922.1 hypothetical protein Smic_84780 [Streptomyces microflavus]GFN10195.1 hypothetical protein Smic_87510 [Streptomyces microflavus]GGX99943.1 hypothetical protein GCM10010298_76280 [Streptomyces microflavus]
MLVEGLIAVAAAGGSAVVQAAGTDAWNGIRDGFARLFGRGEPGREQAELERLDQTRSALEAAGEGAQRVQIAQVARWQTRLETLLEELPAAEQQLVVAELQALVAQAEAARPVETVHNDFSQASFTNSQVLGSGTMTVTNNYDK